MAPSFAPCRSPPRQAYERRRPEESGLYRAVEAGLEMFLARARSRDRVVPRFVERAFRAYLRCGILAYGFQRPHCDACGNDRLVGFSCKGRGICPSCGGRRMAEFAAHLRAGGAGVCPYCGGRRRLLAAILDPAAVRAILDCLGLPSRPPPDPGPSLAAID